MRRSLALIAMALALCALLCACGREPQKFERARYDLFDTVTSLTVYAKSEAEFNGIADVAFAELEAWHRALDGFNSLEGNLRYINEFAARAPVRADEKLFEALSWLKDNERAAGGLVNAALGAVTRLWRDAREAGGPPPDASSLSEAAKHANFDDVILDAQNNTVFFADPRLQLDLGAIGKGYAAKAVIDALNNAGARSYILNIGGNVYCAQPPPGRESFRVAVESPGGSDEAAAIIRVSDMSAVTSGDYQRYFEYEGARYHHIIDPYTLYPARNFSSVTILHKDPALADLYSTRAFIMPYAEGAALVNGIEGMEAMWILPNGEIRATEGFLSRMEPI